MGAELTWGGEATPAPLPERTRADDREHLLQNRPLIVEIATMYGGELVEHHHLVLGEHDEVRSGQQAGPGLGIDRQPRGDDVVDPRLHCARRTEVVQREAEKHGIGALDLIDEFDGQRDGLLLNGRALIGGQAGPPSVMASRGSTPGA